MRVFLRSGAGGAVMAVHQLAAHFAQMRAGQANQPLIIAFGQPLRLELGMGNVAIRAHISAGEQLAQAAVARFVAHQEHGAEWLLRIVRIRHPHIRPYHRLDARATAGFVEFHQAKRVHQIADAQRGQAESGGFLHQLFDAQSAVGDGKFGMLAQGDVNRGGHISGLRRGLGYALSGSLIENRKGVHCTANGC